MGDQDQDRPANSGPIDAEPSDEKLGVAQNMSVLGASNVEGLRINIVTVLGAMVVLASTFITIGLYMSKLTTLETRIDLAERGRSEDKNTISTLRQDLAILETRVRRAEDTQQSDAKKLDKISTTVEAIGEMVLIMCQTSARPGVTCRLRP